jgi:hypothetical protein
MPQLAPQRLRWLRQGGAVAAIVATILLIPIVPCWGASWPIRPVWIDPYAKPAEMRVLEDIDIVDIADHEGCYRREGRLPRAEIDAFYSGLESHVKIKACRGSLELASALRQAYYVRQISQRTLISR